MASLDKFTNVEDRRLWIGNLDTRLTEYQLLKIVQKCGKIDKFDMLFHMSGPQIGQPRGYAFVTYENANAAMTALDKLNGHVVGNKTMVVRLAKNINYNDLEKPKNRIEIPCLAAGGLHNSTSAKSYSTANASSSSAIENSNKKISTEITIQAIEAKLRMLENNPHDLEINRTNSNEPPLIHKYQYNKLGMGNDSKQTLHKKYNSKNRYTNSRPYNQRRQKR